MILFNNRGMKAQGKSLSLVSVVLLLLRCVGTNSNVTSSTLEQRTNSNLTGNVSVTTPLVTNNTSGGIPCNYAPGIIVGNRTRVLQCCQVRVKDYRLYWSNGNEFLTRYLETLSEWSCPQFEEECRNKTYNFHPYATLVYSYFCDKNTFESTCYNTLESTLRKTHIPTNQTTKYTRNNWSHLINQLRNTSLSIQEALQPCIQVAMYEATKHNFGEFQEMVSVDVPTCGVVWCGFNASLTRSGISPWSCMPIGCRSGITVIIVICILFAIFITVGNILILAVIWRTPVLHHSQSVYKFSIALSDFLIGAIVFPASANSILMLVKTPYMLGDEQTVFGYSVVDGSLSSVQGRGIRNQFTGIFSISYLSFWAFFTTVGIAVSVYTLTVAGVDRLIAVYRPLRYRKDRAKMFAKRICVVIWMVTILCGSLPLYVPSLRYSLIASFLVSSAGTGALILYIIAFALPVVAMWIISVATFQMTRKHAKASSHLTADSKTKSRSIETRLARTLSIMVGVFTLNLVPAAIVTIATFLTVSVYYNLPEYLDVSGASVFIAFEFFSFMILASNSLWNFFIYNARNAEFKAALKKQCKEVAKKTGAADCWLTTLGCAQQVAHDGRRRLSSIPTIALSSAAGRKKSSSGDVTAMTKFSSTAKSEASSSGGTTAFRSTAGSTSELKTEKNKSTETAVVSQSSSVSEMKPYQPIYEKKKGQQKQHKEKKEDNATDDSIFQSFAINCNADRLLVSVVDNIEDEIIELDDEGEVVTSPV
ncbi:LOW QUALITY PROTEIN: uncharacterized protein LOC100181847 [Ciona intestinalis]